jgi:hypothetical protein
VAAVALLLFDALGMVERLGIELFPEFEDHSLEFHPAATSSS